MALPTDAVGVNDLEMSMKTETKTTTAPGDVEISMRKTTMIGQESVDRLWMRMKKTVRNGEDSPTMKTTTSGRAAGDETRIKVNSSGL